jgi:hypothetical protein
MGTLCENKVTAQRQKNMILENSPVFKLTSLHPSLFYGCAFKGIFIANLRLQAKLKRWQIQLETTNIADAHE